MSDAITIGIYREEGKDGDKTINISSKAGEATIRAGYAGAIRDMLNIIHKFEAAAARHQNIAPKIYISFLLIPNWSFDRGKHNGNREHYDSPSYAKHKDIYINLFKSKFTEISGINVGNSERVIIIDCLEDGEITDAEKQYMERLTAKGSNADIIKTRAIIARRENNHLQLDSNTCLLYTSDAADE